MSKKVELEISDAAEAAFTAAANELRALAGDAAPSPVQLMQMAVNPGAAAGLYQTFIHTARPIAEDEEENLPVPL